MELPRSSIFFIAALLIRGQQEAVEVELLCWRAAETNASLLCLLAGFCISCLCNNAEFDKLLPTIGIKSKYYEKHILHK